jgi:hypothetical protein
MAETDHRKKRSRLDLSERDRHPLDNLQPSLPERQSRMGRYGTAGSPARDLFRVRGGLLKVPDFRPEMRGAKFLNFAPEAPNGPLDSNLGGRGRCM